MHPGQLKHHLQQQTALLRRYLKRHTHSQPSPTIQVLKQLAKGCEMVMSSTVLLQVKMRSYAWKIGARKRRGQRSARTGGNKSGLQPPPGLVVVSLKITTLIREGGWWGGGVQPALVTPCM
jgi:hypothetical protein